MLALCLYEVACGFELDGLPAVFPAACPPVVCDALEEIKKNYPKLEATQMAAMLRQTKPHWILDL